MAIGRLKNKKKSHKHREREQQEAEKAAAEAALATEQAVARQVEDQVKRHQRLILACIALVIIGGALYANTETQQKNQAGSLSMEWTEAAKTLTAQVKPEAKEPSGDPDALLEYESELARYTAVTEQFEALQAKAAESPVAALANLPLAVAALGQGDGATAKTHLQAFIDHETNDTAFKQAARVMMARALEAEGKGTEGAAQLASQGDAVFAEVSRLSKAAEADDSTELATRLDQARERCFELLLDAAQMYRRAGANDEAVKLLKRLTGDDELKKSSLSSRADRELRILGEGG